MSGLLAPGAFDIYSNPNNLAERWTEWIKRLTTFVLAKGITDASRAEALLLHCAGIDVHNLYDTIDPIKTGVRAPRELRAAAGSQAAVNENVYQVAVRVLTAHFTPNTNRKFEIFKFRQLKQQPSESVTAFCHRLRQNAAHCNFHDKDLELQLQILAGLRNDQL